MVFPCLTPIPARRAMKHILTEDAKSFVLEVMEGSGENNEITDEDVVARVFLDDLTPSAEITVLYHIRR